MNYLEMSDADHACVQAVGCAVHPSYWPCALVCGEAEEYGLIPADVLGVE